MSASDSPIGNKSLEKETEINQPKPAEPQISSSSTLSEAAHVPRRVKIHHRRNAWGETLLHNACKRDDLQSARTLIQAGISVNIQDHAGWTALHEAAAVSSEAMVEELLKAGANPSARSSNGVTPLHDAVTTGKHEVVKLLLQFGSNPSDRTVGGISAWDMAEEEHMKELLQTFRDPLVFPETPCEASEQPGCKSSEAQCHKQLGSQRNFSPNIRSRESGDRAGATEPADIQLRGKHTNPQNLGQSESLMTVLEEIWRKQTEMSTWILSAPEDADRYSAALTQIQNQLIELLNKQTVEKDRLARKQRSVSDSLWQRVLKPRLVSLISRQRKLVEILQKQTHLVEVFVKMKAELSTGSTNRLPSAEDRHRKDLRKRAPKSAEVREIHREAPVLRSAASRPPALYQSKDSQRSLSELMQGGLVKPGCALHVCIKRRLHCAHVLAGGSLKDLKGEVHPSPERWLESVLSNNVPVSSAYAWDKVMFRGEPLSSYSPNQESDTNTPLDDHTCASSAPEVLSSEEGGPKRLMKVRTIRLVEDEEFLPNAVMDFLWEKLLKDQCSDTQWTDF